MLSLEARKELGKFFLDVGKLVFAGVILATSLKLEGFSKISLIIVGISSMVFSVIVGILLLNKLK